MDIHACRFVPFPPSPINALSFSHNHIKKAGHKIQARLAIGRANGDIEIWNPLDPDRWMQEVIIHSGKERSIDGLVWANDQDEAYGTAGNTIYGRSRLFSIGYTSAITEWDLEKRTVKCSASGQHGDIWCFALQPFSPEALSGPVSKRSPESRMLIAGTVDGSLVAYSIEDDNLRFDKVLLKNPKKKSKMVSMAFQSRHVLLVGQAGCGVRVYNLKNGQNRNLRLDYKTETGPSNIIAWAVSCLPNARRDIVVGDSSGHLSIFHGKNYTLIQRIHAHKQDILSLVVNHDGCSIASGGMDRRTVVYSKSPTDVNRWQKTFHSRNHEHDVKAIAAFASPKMDVFVTGGPDTSPIVAPFANAGLEPRRTLSHLPQAVPVATAPKARIVVAWWNREIRIWKLKRTVMENMMQQPGLDGKVDENHKLLSHILIKGDANITSASISRDGSLLVIATSLEVKAFRLKLKTDGNGKEMLRPSKIDLPETFNTGCTKIEISPDGKWICLTRDPSKVYIAKIVQNEDMSVSIHPKLFRLDRLKRAIPKFIQLGGLGSYNRGITHFAFSPDSKMVATVDLAGYIDSWVLKDPSLSNGAHNDTEDEAVSSDSESDEEDTSSSDREWMRNPNSSLIPKLPSPAAVFSFSSHIPSRNGLPAPEPNPQENGVTDDNESEEDDYILLTVTGSSQMRAFHPTLGKLTPWTKRNPYSRFPQAYTKNRDIAKGVVWQGSRAWIWGISFVFMIDMSKDFPAPPEEETGDKALVKGGRKRKRGGEHSTFKPDLGSKSVKVSKSGNGPTKWSEIAEKDDEPPSTTDDEDEAVGELMAVRDDKKKKVAVNSGSQGGKEFWASRKYRPILALLPLTEDEEVAAQREVVLIERPLWDIEMPDRFFGDDEWERR